MSIHIQRAHTADTLAAIVVEYDWLFALVDQTLIQNVQHFQERDTLVDLVDLVSLELSFFLRTSLTPNFKRYFYIFIHDSNFCD